MDAFGDLSRRAFVAGMGAAAATVFAGAAMADESAPDYGISGAVLTDAGSYPWDREADVVVVGCGGAGACAAIAAIEAGCEVTVLEKGDITGGCTLLSGQAVAVAGTQEQKELGIEDTAEDFAEFLHAVSDGDDALLDVVAYNALDAYEWLKGMGVSVPAQAGVPGITFGGSHDFQPEVPRTHWTEGLYVKIDARLNEAGAEVLTGTPASALVVDLPSGAVAGVIAADGTSFKARRGVVLAAGGFSNNPALMKENILKGTYVSFASPNDEGDGIALGQSVGAGTAYLASGNDCPSYLEGACTFMVESYPIPGDPAYIAVNKNGKRFCKDYDFQIPINRSIMSQPDGMCYVVSCGEDGLAGFEVVSGVHIGEDPASMVVSETIEELAEQIGLDPAVLRATIDEWNAGCAQGQDAAFGRTDTLKPIDTPPYAAAEVYPGFSSTLSGLLVNTDMQVLAALGRTPIARLYAAGANSCVLGRIYSGCGVGCISAVVSGRIAGANAAALEPWA